MSKSAKEQVMDFILKNLKKEKDKWGMGVKSKYYEWEKVLEEMNESKLRDDFIEELKAEVKITTEYLKATGQLKDFSEWRNKQ